MVRLLFFLQHLRLILSISSKFDEQFLNPIIFSLQVLKQIIISKEKAMFKIIWYIMHLLSLLLKASNKRISEEQSIVSRSFFFFRKPTKLPNDITHSHLGSVRPCRQTAALWLFIAKTCFSLTLPSKPFVYGWLKYVCSVFPSSFLQLTGFLHLIQKKNGPTAPPNVYYFFLFWKISISAKVITFPREYLLFCTL